MKHSKKIIIILLLMFIVTQLIGIFVTNHYISPENVLPFGLETPTPETNSEYGSFFIQIVIAFIIAIFILFLFLKFKVELILRLWFLTVIIISLGIALNAGIPQGCPIGWKPRRLPRNNGRSIWTRRFASFFELLRV